MSALESKVDMSGIDKLGGKFERQSQMFEERFNSLMRLLDWKADREMIDQSEKRTKAMLDEFAQGIAKYADKDEVFRKLLSIDRQIKKLLEMKTQAIVQQPMNQEISDDAMLIKKPLGPPVTCLACDKRITNYGSVAEFKAWKKLPKDQENKNAKYGPGFSKVL